MKSSFKERLERLGPVRAVSQVVSGSPVVMSLRPSTSPSNVNPVSATVSLARRGLTMLRAKRAIEEMVTTGRVVIELPKVESRALLTAELSDLGVLARSVAGHDVDIRGLRERLNMTQEQFALQFAIDLDTLQNWERKRRKPDKAVQAYLRVIERLPEAASEAQEEMGAPEAYPSH
ncbi:MAG: putative transcriptional regulator [Bradyrhizobium sp.]|nr:putative transcriptional regulator [Bradyrhizobium sp.]